MKWPDLALSTSIRRLFCPFPIRPTLGSLYNPPLGRGNGKHPIRQTSLWAPDTQSGDHIEITILAVDW